MTIPFHRITIIGLGLIGSSIARAAHAHKLANHIVGCDHNEISLAFAIKYGFVHETSSDPYASVKNSDLIILATPPASLDAIAKTIAPGLKAGAIVMDVCSVKEPAIAAIGPHIPEDVIFIPCHPIAGTEHSGVAAGRADLFAHKRVVITPHEPLQEPLKSIVTHFWEGMGARVEGMPAHLHDLIYAYVSHLPQLLAFGMKPLFSDKITGDVIFTKFVRLCASPPELWFDIFTLNRTNILKALDRYLDAVHHIHKELKTAPEGSPKENDKAQALTQLFPRVAASCLITTIIEAEKNAGFSFARYAGTGLADFTAPILNPPDEDMERISAQYHLVGALLGDYLERLTQLRKALAVGEDKLKELL